MHADEIKPIENGDGVEKRPRPSFRTAKDMIIDLNDINMFYEKKGAGPPLILLHGNGEDHHIFDKITARLSSDFTVYALDSRNHGQSQKTGDYCYQTMSEDVFAFIQKLNLGNVNLVGFSDGAIISLMLAMKYETVIRKMALLGINLKPGDLTEESFQFIKNHYEMTGDPLFKMMLEQPDIEIDTIRHIMIPTLVVAAENDVCRPEMYRKLTQSLPNAKLKVVPGHSHDSYVVDQDILYPDFMLFFR